MGFRAFVRPTKRKLVFTAIIFLFLPVVSRLVQCVCEIGAFCPCPYNENISLLAAILAGFKGVQFSSLLVLGLIGAYLLSSFTLNVWKKTPKQKIKENLKPTKGRIVISLPGWVTVVALPWEYLASRYGGSVNFPPLLYSIDYFFDGALLLLFPFAWVTINLFFKGTLLLLSAILGLGGIYSVFADGLHVSDLTSLGALVIIPAVILEWYLLSCLVVFLFNKIRKRYR